MLLFLSTLGHMSAAKAIHRRRHVLVASPTHGTQKLQRSFQQSSVASGGPPGDAAKATVPRLHVSQQIRHRAAEIKIVLGDKLGWFHVLL